MYRINNFKPGFEGRAVVERAPVLERKLAVKAGLGWIGKNSLLLRKGVGSVFFLAEIIGNIELSQVQHVALIPNLHSRRSFARYSTVTTFDLTTGTHTL